MQFLSPPVRVSREDIDECFIAQSFARVLAYDGTSVVGHLRLFKRHVKFEGMDVVQRALTRFLIFIFGRIQNLF